jgi:signal peptidase I
LRRWCSCASARIALPEKAARAASAHFAAVEVPPGHVFVLGDNRHHAHDSRGAGTVPFDTILARADGRL